MVLKRAIFATFEAWAVACLLRSPAFHRGVQKIARGVHRLRHGTPPEELGGTSLEQPERLTGFLKHFRDELKEQAGFKGRDGRK